MSSEAGGESQLVIGRLTSVYLVSQGHPAPDRLRSQLDQTMRTRLPDACARWLASALDPADPSVWLIRRLELDLALDAGGLDDETIARAWSRGIATAVVRAIERGPDGQSVLYFPDRTAYLAYFLGELVDGRAWGRWYLAEFEPLRSLPPGTVAAQALSREASWAEPALIRLAEQGKLDQLLALMTGRDAALVLDACAATGSPGAPVQVERLVADALLTLWVELVPGLGLEDRSAEGIALRLYVEARRRFPELSPGSLRLSVERLISLANLVQEARLSLTELAELAVSDIDAARTRTREAGASAGIEGLGYFARVAGGDTSWLAGALGAIRAGAPRPAGGAHRASGEIISTPIAGLFLLLPSLVELRVHESMSAARYEAPGGLDTPEALRFLVLLKLCGRERSPAARYDPALLAAAGLERPPAADDLAAFTAQAGATEAHRCLAALAGSIARSGVLDLRCLHVEMVDADENRAFLLHETERGDWVYAAPDRWSEAGDAAFGATLAQGLNLVAEATGVTPECLLVDPATEAAIDATAPALRGLRLIRASDVPGTRDVPGSWPDLAGYLSRARPSEPEIAYFSLGGQQPPLVTNAAFDLAWSAAARAVFRAFARTLLGFRDNSTPYLWENFLGGIGQVQVGRDSIDVRLPLSPLRMMLRLAGHGNMTYTVPWLGDVEIRVRLPEE